MIVEMFRAMFFDCHVGGRDQKVDPGLRMLHSNTTAASSGAITPRWPSVSKIGEIMNQLEIAVCHVFCRSSVSTDDCNSPTHPPRRIGVLAPPPSRAILTSLRLLLPCRP